MRGPLVVGGWDVIIGIRAKPRRVWSPRWAHTNMGNITGRNGDIAFLEGMNRNISVCDIF